MRFDKPTVPQNGFTHGMRLAPWATDLGRPVFMQTAPGGRLDQLSNRVEADQLDWVRTQLSALAAMDPTQGGVGRDELVRHLAHTAIASETALRVADLRGLRLEGESSTHRDEVPEEEQ